MPKKKKSESQKEQSKRFLEKAQELTDAGDLSPTEAEEKFKRAMDKVAAAKETLPKL